MSKAPFPSFLDLRRPSHYASNMPVFYPPSQMRHLPLTPPEYYEDFAQFGKGKPQHFGYQSYDDLPQNPFLMNSGSNYYQPSFAEQQARYEAEMKRQARAHYQAQVQREHVYGPIAAPVLPPLRVAEQQPAVGDANFRGSSAQAAAPKEEKASGGGGVAAHLDYDMDTMVDFVAEMATGMFNLYVTRVYLPDYHLVRSIDPDSKLVNAKFRSYVSSVLTSTRLPKATILLAMHYLAGRMTLLSSQNQVHHRFSNALYHLLTVGLMLSSKFLDDNTFQNRSWAEVSNLSVTELNTREADWLGGMCYRLHVDWEETHGVRAWFERWDAYETRQKTGLSLEALKLSPVDTSVRGYRNSRYSPPGASFTPPELEPQDVYGQSRRSMSPPSARHNTSNNAEFYPQMRNAISYMDLRPQQTQYQRQSLFPHQHLQALEQQQQQQQQQQQPAPNGCVSNDTQGDLVYTRESPVYGPGYVLETRSNGMCTWEVHNFVGIEYTQQYAAQLQIGWCEMHRRLDCMACVARPAMSSMPVLPLHMQAVAA